MNKDDLKEFLKTIKINKVSQKLQNYKSDFYFCSEIDERIEIYRITKQDRVILNNLLFNFFRDRSQQHCRI